MPISLVVTIFVTLFVLCTSKKGRMACLFLLPIGGLALLLARADVPHQPDHVASYEIRQWHDHTDQTPPIDAVVLDGHSIPVVDHIESHVFEGQGTVIVTHAQSVSDDPWGYNEDKGQSSDECEYCDDECEECTEDCEACEEDDSEGAKFVWEHKKEPKDRASDQLMKSEKDKSQLLEDRLLVVEKSVKPEWIYDTVDFSGDKHRMTAQIGPYESDQVVRHKTEEEVRRAIDKYAQWYLESTGRPVSAATPVRMNLSVKRIRECIVDRFDDVHQSPETPGMDPMPVTYRLLEFDDDFRNQVIERYWNQSLSVERSVRAGVVSGGVLGLLAVVLGFLKLDTVTDGGHRRKLAAAATGIVGMGILSMVAVMSYLLGW